jgi:hypothetical protein
VIQRDPPDAAGRGFCVGHGKRHTEGEGEIGEVPVRRRLVLLEVDPTRVRFRAWTASR